MILRFIMRYLANNEQLINKLAESKPVRSAARLVVYVLTRSSTLSGRHRLPSDPTEFGKQLREIAQKFSTNLKKEVQSTREELAKKRHE